MVIDGHYVGLLSLGLRKAFDLVDHQILIGKLKGFKIKRKIINLLESYLHDRKQVIYENFKYSKPLNLKSGVPQVSLIGPVLFNIMMNDIFELKLHGSLTLYADITLITSDKNLTSLQDKMNDDIQLLEKWFFPNKLVLNPQKSSFLLI